MGKIAYYAWIGFWIILGLPIVLVILLGLWVHDKYHQLTCKKCLIK